MGKQIMQSPNEVVGLSCLPYGAGHDREGISLLLTMGEHRMLLDCGVTSFPFANESNTLPIEFVFCSHAHQDHCRGLLALHQAFPKLPIYTSEITAQLLTLYWPNSIIESMALTALPWRSPKKLGENLELELYPAGHLPGAAALVLTYQTKKRDYKVLYTGDFSLSNFQLVEGLSIEGMRGLEPDVLIIEGSYGTVRHPHRRQQEKYLMERIERALKKGENILLPVAPLGLGQEILKLLRSHHQFTGKDLDIWVDQTVAKACDVYLGLLSQLPASVQNFAKHQSLFWDERICPRMSTFSQFEEISGGKLPCIVMVDHDNPLLDHLVPDWGKWLILFAELLSDDTAIGSKLREQVSNKQVSDIEYVTAETYLLAEHSDGRNTTQLIHNLRPQHIVFVHGSQSYLIELASLKELYNRYKVHAPLSGNLVEFPLGDRFVQPIKPISIHYEGQLNEVGSYITMLFPDSISGDPRWNKFSDTGIIEARWQGNELVLRGISQQELLNSDKSITMSEDLECCNSCIHYRSQRCWNPNSPLYEFKVMAEGYCPVYER
ncbi:putative exonuclease of the beta-lactamase fold involved in RNA processing [Xenococcus sp. PCC 7305]|uniref:MBL fold metallo-hydrolase n=1 Tax=Xenococcus sp. PCC 7305 TaxID=102125 RepID=UPI0002ABC257|nr:MBL fold metallo-hydrolase [Xenococcus sp. PCC 7305]ELS02373.1 putative exonuclease of the beta-lactamase fold involved in RNA processing [Xenococcus sp. PCC 7305]